MFNMFLRHIRLLLASFQSSSEKILENQLQRSLDEVYYPDPFQGVNQHANGMNMTFVSQVIFLVFQWLLSCLMGGYSQ